MADDDCLYNNEAAPLLPDAERHEFKGPVDSWWAEVWLLAEYSLPLIATYLLQYSFTVITTFVAGHLGAEDLAAASIGVTTMNIVGLSIFEGMATALDTLCAQAYGSGHATGVGLHVQRMLLLMLLAALPIGAIWLCSPSVLPLFVRQRELAVKAGAFLQVSLIGLPGYASFEAGKRFLQAQGDFRTGMVILIICAPVNILLAWIFVFKLEMGLSGAALGAALTNDLRVVLLLLYIVVFGTWSHKCWGGVSHSTLFRDWSPMVQLSLAGSALTLAEWAAFEILTFSTSYVSTVHLAAQTILTTMSVIVWHVPFSVSVAVSTRVGHLIGAGRVLTARRAVVLYGVVFTAIGICDGAFLILLRDRLGPIFSDDAIVQDIVAKSMYAVGAFQVFDAIICGCNGTLRGLSRQSVAACVVFAVDYLVAVPFAIWLELGRLHLDLNGVWIGLGLGMVVIAIIECTYMKLISWQDCVNSVRLREET
ncbi:putative mate efflux family protein [Phaeoacremonium minimum UCRPA7]|uniref:Putative mate efflux family protein n=1 Tax=Phaeoacremonium minimum (strain UCR-PA7) TaxID=1286976 RepID=R8B9B0_PHAM7|nr:putative mate efflux family protein [Phaeoacremonium minimum UCRPA7]EON95877.1 putative mate efflux family protein [Phaeoacremonium minimum UCRPA7]